jgi:hypothetical protein
MELGVVPIDAPRAVTTLCPVARSKTGTSSRYAAEKPPEIMTRISAPPAALVKNIMLTRTKAHVPEAIGFVLMRTSRHYRRDCRLLRGVAPRFVERQFGSARAAD